MNNFKTSIQLDLSLDRQDNYDLDTKTANLRWNLEFEMRQYGVKSVIITVPDQKISVGINIWGDDDDTYEELTLDVKDVIVEQPENLSQLIPKSLELYKGKWKLVF